jgi:lipopolysaccharide export system protein LptA
MITCSETETTHPKWREFMPRRSPVLLLLLILTTGLAQALPDDRDQPIHISADKALRDEKQGFTEYTGNVQMEQGSMRLDADKLTIYHATEEVEKVVAEGRPARMQQQPELDKGVVHAHAGVIEYFRSEERVHLQSNARIEQDGSVVSGDSIDYFITEQLVKADSDQAVEGNRVNVVIPPNMPSGATKSEQSTKTEAAPPPGSPLPPATEDNASGATDSE